jgi:phosphonate transport system permease protein
MPSAAIPRTKQADLIAQALRIAPEAIRVPVLTRLRGWAAAALFALALYFAIADLGLSFEVIGDGMGKLGQFFAAMWPPSDGDRSQHILFVILQTLAMAVIGTGVAIVLAVPVGLIAAHNIVPHPAAHFAIRRFLDLFRGVPVLVWALIMVAAFGLGPVPGILAIILTDIPRLAKLFAEAMENVDQRQLASLRVTGAGPLAVLRFGTLPQMLPVWLSQCIYYLEQNFRSAAIVGVVGGGGIGFELQELIRIFAFDQVAFITLIYILAVGLLDIASDRLRARLS